MYTVKIHTPLEEDARMIMDEFVKGVLACSPFVVKRYEFKGFDSRRSLAGGFTQKNGWLFALQQVRLQNKKPYTGQQPQAEHRGMKAAYLSWEDWVNFHAVLNAHLDSRQVSADVWSTPFDVKGKLWIRKGKAARVEFAYEERVNSYGRITNIWDPGDKIDHQYKQVIP